MKIVFTGGSGRFGKKFRDKTRLKNISYPSSKEMNITDYNSIKKYLSKHKPKIVIHCAALSRPMDIHDRQINKSIDINIIGTSNLVSIHKNTNSQENEGRSEFYTLETLRWDKIYNLKIITIA